MFSSAPASWALSEAPQGIKKERRSRRRPRLKFSERPVPLLGSVPVENVPFPAEMAGFLISSRPVPVYPGFSIILSPYTLIDKAQAAQYLELCSQLESCPFSSRKTMDLAAHYRGMLASCKLEDCLLLIKEIYTKQRELASHGKKLGQVDQQYLKLAERLVCEEFSAVLHTTPELVKKQMYAAMRRKTAVSKEAAVQKAAL